MKVKEHSKTRTRICWIIGIILFIIGLLLGYYINVGWGSIIISLGVAIVVYGLSIKTEIFTEETKVMTEDIALSSFKETIGIFEDRRLVLREKIKKYDYKMKKIKKYSGSHEEELDKLDLNIYLSFSVWKCRTYLDRALIYEKYFEDRDQDTLIHWIDCLFQDSCEGIALIKLVFLPEAQNHFMSMYDTILKFKRFHNESAKDQFRRERILINLKFLKGLSKEFIIGF